MSHTDQNDRKMGRAPQTATRAEVTQITPWIRFGRFLGRVLGIVLVIVGFGLGVLSGTSGVYSDAISEMRRLVNVEPGDGAPVARVIDALARLDAAVGIDPVRTRHGVAQTVHDLGDLCEAGIDDATEEMKARLAGGIGSVTRVVAQNQLEQSQALDDLRQRAAEIETLAASTENFCALTLQRINELLGVVPAPSTGETPTEETLPISEE